MLLLWACHWLNITYLYKDRNKQDSSQSQLKFDRHPGEQIQKEKQNHPKIWKGQAEIVLYSCKCPLTGLSSLTGCWVPPSLSWACKIRHTHSKQREGKQGCWLPFQCRHRTVVFSLGISTVLCRYISVFFHITRCTFCKATTPLSKTHQLFVIHY